MSRSASEHFRTGKSNLYNSDAFPLEHNFERQVKPNLALQVMRGRNKSPNASVQWGSKTTPADGSSAPLAGVFDGAQLLQQPTTPTTSEKYEQYDQHSRRAQSRTRTTRHSTSGLPSFGLQQNVNGSTDPVPRLGLLKGRSSSSRGLDCQPLVEDHASEQVRPTGTPRVLQPSNLRVSPAGTPSAVRDPPYPFSHAPDSSSPISSLQSALPQSSRRPSLLRTSSANSNSAATTVWSYSHALPNITSPGGSGATTSAAVFHPHPPASPAHQPQPYSLSPTGLVGFTSPASPVPPSSPRVPQSNLGIRRGHPPPSMVSSSAWLCPSPGGGASPAASPAAMSRSSNSFRTRLLNFREVASPASPSSSASSSVPLTKSAPGRGNTTIPNDDDPGASQQELRNRAHHSLHFMPLLPHPVAHDQSCEDEDVRQFQSAPLPLETPNGSAASLDDVIVNGGAPPPVTLPAGRGFRRNVVLRSDSLETQLPNATGDEWIEAHVGGGVGGIDVISCGPAVVPTAPATSSSAAAATRSSFPQATIWEGASLAVTCGTGPRRTQSDWGARLVSGAALGADVVADSSLYVARTDDFPARDLRYGNTPRRAAMSVSGGGMYGSTRHLSTEEVQRSPHQHHHNAATHTVPGCVSRLRLFEGTETLYIQEEMDEDVSDARDDGSEEADYDSDTTVGTRATVSAGQEMGSVAVELAPLNQILDPILDVLDPGRLVARRCMRRLQNGTNGLNRPRAVESWAESEAALKVVSNGPGQSDVGNWSDCVAAAVGCDGGAATITATSAAPALATLAGQVLKLPCVGLEKLSDPEKRQKVVQRLREAGSVFANKRPGNNTRWQP
ncbi:hypothetical protein VaNZ11_012918 [Volvox africanus]|uniref:Uncharacterized protein n=1 Tax=Volvox africanus TaxID=51714 RepID=A0ABQ5SF24_9CHLO|nr:hypothetical protein VaNZ11_012918 [Volvox africanus]